MQRMHVWMVVKFRKQDTDGNTETQDGDGGGGLRCAGDQEVQGRREKEQWQ